MRESEYQSRVIKRCQREFPGCVVVKNDPNYIQGIPDLLVLHQDKWAMLECKRSEKESVRPNQLWWVDYLSKMSRAFFIYPENEEEVFNALRQTFGVA